MAVTSFVPSLPGDISPISASYPTLVEEQNNIRGGSTAGSSIIQVSGDNAELYGTVKVKSSTLVGISNADALPS